jgi:hypothetical protein
MPQQDKEVKKYLGEEEGKLILICVSALNGQEGLFSGILYAK